MKAWRDGSGVSMSFEKALVYCWRACIYFMPPQIVGKGRASSVCVIREVERESVLPQRPAFSDSPLISLGALKSTLTLAHIPLNCEPFDHEQEHLSVVVCSIRYV